ncbi:hypothetical protein RUM43_008017 [Polyplax serrata]|uniref:Laminin G domain-containing protein n=1 Tax=Polyplax serrata TaxID=468196 RepID=A0AAN8PYA6_POLSC
MVAIFLSVRHLPTTLNTLGRKAPSEATFLGSEFLSYDLNATGGVPIVSSQDVISFSFKTRYPNGLLYFTGHGESYLNIALKQGGIILKMGMGNENLEMNIRPHKIRFDDNQWHTIAVRRKVQLIIPYIGTSFCRLYAMQALHLTLTVDGTYSDHSHLHGHFSMIYSSQVYVGGNPASQALPGSSVPNNFTGCLRRVEFVADTLKINLIDLGRTGSKFLTVVGHMEFKCHERKLEDPVQFLDKDSHLRYEVKHSVVLTNTLRVNITGLGGPWDGGPGIEPYNCTTFGNFILFLFNAD